MITNAKSWMGSVGLSLVIVLIWFLSRTPPGDKGVHRKGPDAVQGVVAIDCMDEMRLPMPSREATLRIPALQETEDVPGETAREEIRGILVNRTEHSARAWRRKALKWPHKTPHDPYHSPTINPEGKELSAADAEYLDQIIEDYDQIISDLSAASFETLKLSLAEYFDRGMYLLVGEHEEVPPDHPIQDGSKYTLSMTLGGTGWGGAQYHIRFRSVEFPQLQAELEHIGHIKEERSEAVNSYIASL